MSLSHGPASLARAWARFRIQYGVRAILSSVQKSVKNYFEVFAADRPLEPMTYLCQLDREKYAEIDGTNITGPQEETMSRKLTENPSEVTKGQCRP